jgi:hypothetical protein
MTESAKFPVYCINDIKQLVYCIIDQHCDQPKFRNGWTFKVKHSLLGLTGMLLFWSLMSQDLASMGFAPIGSPTRSVRDAQGQNEAHISKCPSVLGAWRESLQIQIRQDSTYCAEKKQPSTGFIAKFMEWQSKQSLTNGSLQQRQPTRLLIPVDKRWAISRGNKTEMSGGRSLEGALKERAVWEEDRRASLDNKLFVATLNVGTRYRLNLKKRIEISIVEPIEKFLSCTHI